MGYAICAIRLAEQTIDDYQLAPGPNFAGSGSMLRIGRSSGDLRPSHRTITLALLAVTRSTTPHRSVQSSWPGRMLLNAAAAREVSFTLSPRLIIFNARFSQPNKLAGRRCLRSHPPAPLVRERSERGLVIRAKLLSSLPNAQHRSSQISWLCGGLCTGQHLKSHSTN